MSATTLPSAFFLASLALWLPQAASAQGALASGPPVSFERRGAEVCASYALDGSRSLYRERVYAFESGARLPILGLPAGKPKVVGGERVALLESSFKACARASSSSAPAAWVDQSCATAQGVCLPPRGFEVDASGKARALAPQAAAALFAKGFAPAEGSVPGASPDGWSFKLDIKR